MKILRITINEEQVISMNTSEGEMFTTYELFGIAKLIEMQAEMIEKGSMFSLPIERRLDEMGDSFGRPDTGASH